MAAWTTQKHRDGAVTYSFKKDGLVARVTVEADGGIIAFHRVSKLARRFTDLEAAQNWAAYTETT